MNDTIKLLHFDMKRKIRLILLVLAILLFGAAIVKFFLCNDNNLWKSALTISSNKSIFVPGDTMHISVSVTASQIDAATVDAYVLVQEPSGGFSSYYSMPGWNVEDSPPTEIASIPLKNQNIGPYKWFFVLCHPGHDLFDTRSWVAIANVEVFLLPVNGVSSLDDNKALSFFDPSHPVLIAHAAGEIEGRPGPNTREALDHNYARGHRYFEIDFCWTSDRHLVLIHDWQATFTTLFMDANEQPTLERFEFMNMKYGMTQMSLKSLYRWLSKHNDAYIITDVKDQNLAGLELIAMTAGNLKERFIPQIYGPSEFEPVKKLGFKDIILTLYRTTLTEAELLKFSSKYKLFAVTMSARKAFSFSRIQDLKQQGVFIYAHTINQTEVLKYLRKKGVYGIYTDRILPGDIIP